MTGYTDFSRFYDALTNDVDYSGRTEYLLKLFENYKSRPTLLLDLACGTGGFSMEFSKRGIETIGVDISPEMLSVAKEKAKKDNLDVLFLCQDATELDLFGTVDGAICCLDSLNHITDYRDFKKAIGRVSLFLEKGKLFIFDLNTEYKHKTVLGNNTFVVEDESVYCVWQNAYDEKRKQSDICLDFFEEQNGTYNRYCEEFSERYYDYEKVKKALLSANLEILAVYEELTEKEPRKDTQRVVYVTRRI